MRGRTIWAKNQNCKFYIAKGIENISTQKTSTQIFTAPLFIMPKKWKQSKCPSTDKWINNMVYSYNEILFSNERKWNTDTYIFWMNFANTMLSKRSQSQKITYFINPFKLNVQNKQIWIFNINGLWTERRFEIPRDWGRRRGY